MCTPTDVQYVQDRDGAFVQLSGCSWLSATPLFVVLVKDCASVQSALTCDVNYGWTLEYVVCWALRLASHCHFLEHALALPDWMAARHGAHTSLQMRDLW